MTLQEEIAEVRRITDEWGPWYEGHFPPGMKAFAAIGNAVASGDLIPKADLVEAEARGLDRAADLVEGSVYTSIGSERSLEPVKPKLRGMDMHHATIARAIRAEAAALRAGRETK